MRTYSLQEERKLAENLSGILEGIHAGSAGPPSQPLLLRIHLRLFEGVRSHGGSRRPDHGGSEYLTFGPQRSVAKNRVIAELDAAFEKLGRALRSFEENPEAERYDEQALHLAAWIHAEVIRIHPFEDGNGRTSRALANATLVHLGLHPIALEACKQEYYDHLNHYFRTRDITQLVDFFIELYGV